MTATSYDRVLEAVDKAGLGQPARGKVRCPVHDDHQPSLSIKYEAGRTLMLCRVCGREATRDIVAALGLTMRDLFDEPKESPKSASWKIVATYPYVDAAGTLLFEVTRRANKQFPCRRPDPDNPGKWIDDLDGVEQRPLFRLPRIIEAVTAGTTVWVVEGEKDVQSLELFGLVATTHPGGADKSGGQSKWRPEHTSTLKGAHVRLITDADTAGRAHAAHVARVLRPVVASLVCLEPVEGKDISDHLAFGHTIEELVETDPSAWATPPASQNGDSSTSSEGTKPLPPGAPTGDDFKDRGAIPLLASHILDAGHRWAQDNGGHLYRYHRGTYRPDGKQAIQRHAKQLLADWGQEKRWTARLASDLVEYLRVDAPTLWDRPPLDRINVANGILHLPDLNLHPHSPDHLSPIQIPHPWQPDAQCPQWDQFIAATFPPDAAHVAWELIALLLTPDTTTQRAFLLTGEGSNGKSRYLTNVEKVVGPKNVAAVPLHKLETDRFAAARLVGKLANICADLPSAHLDTTSTFKALVTGDRIDAERKHVDGFEFHPYARLVFSANHPPRSSDASHAFFRRWTVIPFTNTFEDGSPGHQTAGTIDTALQAPAELAGALRKAVDHLAAVRARGHVDEPASLRAALEEFRASTDPLAVWLDRNTVTDPAAHVVKTTLHRAYITDCEKKGRPVVGREGFARALRRVRPDLTDVRPRVDGEQTHAWAGIGLRARSDDGMSSGDGMGEIESGESRSLFPESGKKGASTCTESTESGTTPPIAYGDLEDRYYWQERDIGERNSESPDSPDSPDSAGTTPHDDHPPWWDKTPGATRLDQARARRTWQAVQP